MNYNLSEELAKAEQELQTARQKVSELRNNIPHQEVSDYSFKSNTNEDITLLSLFGDKDDLIIIHNMGKNCPYCTLWADGFKGFIPHLENRAGFALVSPDSPEVLKEFSEPRNWDFKVLSNNGGKFTSDMGFEDDQGNPQPGLSTFYKKDGKLYRASSAPFGPGDDFCSIWHMFDMLKNGVGKWGPKYSY